jgi:hypothetical protein
VKIPALTENLPVSFVPSPREKPQILSVAVRAAGSSMVGKSFIKLMTSLDPESMLCNPSRLKVGTNQSKLKPSHVPAFFFSPVRVEHEWSLIVGELNRRVFGAEKFYRPTPVGRAGG